MTGGGAYRERKVAIVLQVKMVIGHGHGGESKLSGFWTNVCNLDQGGCSKMS